MVRAAAALAGAFAFWLAVPSLAGAEAAGELDLKALFQKGIPRSPFIAPVYAYADAVLEDAGHLQAPRDQNLLRLLFFLRELSGQEKYSKAAEGALRSFLEGARPPPHPPMAGEASGPWLLWEKCFDLSSEASRRLALPPEAERPVKEQGVKERDGEEGAASPRHAGFSIRAWAEAHARTGDPAFLEAIARVLATLEDRPAEDHGAGTPASRLSFAIDLDGAARKVPEPLRTRLALHARAEDDRFTSLRHPLKERKGFLTGPLPGAQGGSAEHGCTALWEGLREGQGGETTAQVALMCVSRYENTGDLRHRDLALAAAEAYLDSLPAETADAWPMALGHAISLELAAFRVTTREKYFQRAYRLGELAIEKFFAGRRLPRASVKSDAYGNTTGADTLALALADLHLTTLHITAVRVPANNRDR